MPPFHFSWPARMTQFYALGDFRKMTVRQKCAALHFLCFVSCGAAALVAWRRSRADDAFLRGQCAAAAAFWALAVAALMFFLSAAIISFLLGYLAAVFDPNLPPMWSLVLFNAGFYLSYVVASVLFLFTLRAAWQAGHGRQPYRRLSALAARFEALLAPADQAASVASAAASPSAYPTVNLVSACTAGMYPFLEYFLAPNARRRPAPGVYREAAAAVAWALLVAAGFLIAQAAIHIFAVYTVAHIAPGPARLHWRITEMAAGLLLWPLAWIVFFTGACRAAFRAARSQPPYLRPCLRLGARFSRRFG